MATHADIINDMALLVIDNHYAIKDYADLASKFPDLAIVGKWFTRRKKAEGGKAFTFETKMKNVGNYRSNVGLFDEDQPSRDDMFVEGRARWTGLNIGTYFDVNEKQFMMPGTAVKVNYLKALFDAAFQRFMERTSVALWDFPDSYTDTDRGILGFPYWVAKSSATTAEAFGFNGEDVYGDNLVGNINQSTYPRWRNGTGVFNELGTEAGLGLLSEAMDRCNFRTTGANLGSPDNRSVSGKYEMFTTYDNFQDLEEYTRNQNDNIGADAGKYRGSVVFRSTPIMYLWELTDGELDDGTANPAQDTSNPLYGINWDTFYCYSLLGTGVVKTGPRPAPNQRFVRRVDWDQFTQNICVNRRKDFVIHKAS